MYNTRRIALTVKTKPKNVNTKTCYLTWRAIFLRGAAILAAGDAMSRPASFVYMASNDIDLFCVAFG